MTKYKIKIIFLFLTFVFLITNVAFTQDRIIKLDKELKNLAKTNPSLLEMVDVSVSGVSIQEFLRGVASNVKVNISVDPSLQITVVNNFSDVMIIDMLLFLAKEHDLELSITGNIISVSKYNPPVKETPIQKPRELIINYNKDKDLLSYELNNDSLSKVTREITKQSDKNIVLGTSITGKTVNGFAQNMSFEKGIEMLAYSNDLLFIKNEEGIYMLDKPEPTKNNNQGNNANQNFKTTKKETKSKDTALTVIMQGPDSILVKGQSVQIADVVKEVSEKQGVNFCLISEIKGKTNINFSGITYEDI